MATVMEMRWDGVTPEQYEEARKLVNWEGEAPDGARFHIAWFVDGGLRVIDLWDSAEDFERFGAERLMPGIEQVGIEGQPDVQFHEAHAVFAPAYE